MVKSTFISNILDLLTDAPGSLIVREQIKHIEEDVIDYTPMGVFVYFKHDEKAFNYLLKNKEIYLDGVSLESKEFEGQALAILHFNEGLVDNLEIYATSGTYINREPLTYQLNQNFENSAQRKIIIK